MPLFKCTSSKSTPRKAISYITDPNKAEFVSVRNLFEDEDYASQFKRQSVSESVKGMMRENIII